MHVYFSGIGGTAIGPLALIANKAGWQVSGSDKQDSRYITYLKDHHITNIHIGQTYEQIAAVHAIKPIDWFVYTSALPMEQPDAPELRFCSDHGIRTTKRDVFLSALLTDKQLKLIAIAGTHGKTTTTAMTIWLMKQLGIPISYSVGAKISFGDMGEFNPSSQYFVYEADEFDRNFLAFHPFLSIIPGIDWDHPDIYPTRQSYNAAFHDFISQSAQTVLWQSDSAQLDLPKLDNVVVVPDVADPPNIPLAGLVNRKNATLVAWAVHALTGKPLDELNAHLAAFPGVARRFERVANHIYSDYAHTPAKIRGALQLAHEVAGDRPVVVVYEGLHNTRQHFIKDDLEHLFDAVSELYVVPTYLARENPHLPVLSPSDLIALLSDDARRRSHAALLDTSLADAVKQHVQQGHTVLCISAGGGNSLDEWIRQNQ